MTTIPFGQTVWLWRLARGLTQEEVARRARVPRPNLSMIERGTREVSLKTLRALAAGLEVRPGVLVDGISPIGDGAAEPAPLSRDALERIADAVVGAGKVYQERERVLVEVLRKVVCHQAVASTHRRGRPRRGKRAMEEAWLLLGSGYPPETVRSLFQRIVDRQRPR